MPTEFYAIMQERDGERYLPVTISGARDPNAARCMIETAALAFVGFRDSYHAASTEAAQLNNANGISDRGCATCG